MSRLVSAEEARGLLKGATPGPWYVDSSGRGVEYNSPDIGAVEVVAWTAKGDTKLIAAAPDLAATVIALSGGFESCVRLATWMSDAQEALDYNGCGMAGDEAIVLMKRLVAERDRLRAILACERGESAPEGWRWEWQTRRWINASTCTVVSAGSWFIGIDGPRGTARYMLECIEAADRAAGEVARG